MPSVRLALREATAENHRRVDDAFGRFDLGSAGAYGDFLEAHARALPAVESAVAAAAPWADFRPRAGCLLADIAKLGRAAPASPALAPPSAAAAWGMAYVLEGSKLGGAVLAGRVAAGLPTTYLRGEGPGWRSFQDALEAAGSGQDETWLEEAKAGARAAFALFERAAA